MSDQIFKFYPVNEVNDNKVLLLEKKLCDMGFLGQESEHWDQRAFKIGKNFKKLLHITNELDVEGFEGMRIVLKDETYVVVDDNGDENDAIMRKNVIEIWYGSNHVDDVDEVINLLKSITGDDYSADWEYL